ncbi:hypothetical protein HG535_0E01250 [Zygotorulaspora mrakii]|uniref:Uncharacterized protein n=1 Tax=Zygotorulaspora mrakii TaxID=42260 RepID=A0A7H9B307_ZYGMR|nr:uncharacterized protein HG535_0E01250 [Zygotorulaspora mrakii]QLG73041.1 hypothetical protein HG535_0E01250 [Zygotorulaspora mrakii]
MWFNVSRKTAIFQSLTILYFGSVVSGGEMEEIYVVKRADSSTDSSTPTSTSGSSRRSSTGARCTGSRAECQRPSNVGALTVGLAIAIPVGVVILVCAVVLYKVYRRNKKEAEEDNDPDFDGDAEYMPSVDYQAYNLGSVSNSSNSRTPMDNREKYDNYFPPLYGNHNNPGYRDSYRSSRQKMVDPFFVPHVSDENSLRDFAKQIQSEDLGPYRIASNHYSRSASHSSLPSEKNLASMSRRNNSSLNTSTLNDPSNLQKSKTQETDSTSSTGSHIYESPVKSTAGEATEQYVEHNSGYDVEHSRNDTTMDDSFSNHILKPEPSLQRNENRTGNGISRDTFNFEMLNGSDIGHQSPFGNDANEMLPRENRSRTAALNEKNSDDVREQNRILHLSAEEEENIQRMKSIYKVYLDRNGTVKQNPFENDAEDKEPLEDIPVRKSVERSLANDVHQESNLSEVPVDQSALHDSQNELNLPEQSHRIASSIYSALPPQVPEFQQYQQLPISNGRPLENDNYKEYGPPYQSAGNGPTQQYPTQQYPTQQYPTQQYPTQQYPTQQYPVHQPYPMQNYSNHPYANQYAHPQTFESIDELPTPTNLPYSSSSHSLTSFKQKSKQVALTQLQAARVNGTAVNPTDHPDMFYSQDALHLYSNNGYNQPRAPYQLRQSVVMTNPSDLVGAPRFKPAGSIRNMSSVNSRNNSMTTGLNQQFLQSQIPDNRVSGLLNDHDLIQPPSVTGILPHSSSQEDLRKQIGTSHNYNVF